MVTIAGRASEIVCRPPSISRVTESLSLSFSTFEANVPCAQPINAASIWPVWLESSSIACLPRMIRSGFSSPATAFNQLGDAERFYLCIGLDENAAVSAHGQCLADLILRFFRADGNGDNFFSCACFFQPNRFFDGDFIKRGS